MAEWLKSRPLIVNGHDIYKLLDVRGDVETMGPLSQWGNRNLFTSADGKLHFIYVYRNNMQ